MPFTPVSIVKALLKNRHQLKSYDQIKEICSLLFDLALRDNDTAEMLFAEPNRFVLMIPNVIVKEKLLQFAQNHNEHLVEKLINLAKLTNEPLIQEMRQAVLIKQNIDQQFNALLKRIQPIERKHILLGQRKKNTVMGRTHLAIQRNSLIQDRNNTKGIMLNNEFIPMVTRYTRNFNKKLCSVGASREREVILLNPEEQLLKELYKQLQKQLPTSSDPQVILEAVKKLTRSCFTGTTVNSLVKKNLRNGKQIISLSEFILRRQGVCRHHALLNAYFLSRLVQEGLLQGEVIHHRQNFPPEGAHTWNIFHAQNGKWYSLDSLWDDVTCITDRPGTINSLYRQNVEAKIKEMHFSAPQKERPVKKQGENQAQAAIIKKQLEVQKEALPRIQNNAEPFSPPPNKENINQIKRYIENFNFSVGVFFLWQGGLVLKLEDGREKRVPHRVYEIYQMIRGSHENLIDPSNTQELWQKIQTHAQKALDCPRFGRDSKTTEFYRHIVHNNKLFVENEKNVENKVPCL